MIDIRETLTVIIIPNWLVVFAGIWLMLSAANDALRLYAKYLEWKLRRKNE